MKEYYLNVYLVLNGIEKGIEIETTIETMLEEEVEMKSTESAMTKTHSQALTILTSVLTTLAMTPSEITELMFLQQPQQHPDSTTVTCSPDTKDLITMVLTATVIHMDLMI